MLGHKTENQCHSGEPSLLQSDPAEENESIYGEIERRRRRLQF